MEVPAMGIGIQFSFLLAKALSLQYQLEGIYLVAIKAVASALNSGFNLQDTISLSLPVGRHFSLAISLLNLCGEGITNMDSNQDEIAIGLRWNFYFF
jgi:hypothetical protein